MIPIAISIGKDDKSPVPISNRARIRLLRIFMFVMVTIPQKPVNSFVNGLCSFPVTLDVESPVESYSGHFNGHSLGCHSFS